MNKIKSNWYTIGIILLLGLFVMLGQKITFVDMGSKNSGNVFSDFTIGDFGVYLLSIVLLTIGIYLLRWAMGKYSFLIVKGQSRRFSFGKLCIVSGILLVMWIPWYLHLFPGVLTPDSLTIVDQTLENYLHNHHPVMYTLFAGSFLRLGEMLGDIHIGIALFSAVQSLIVAITLGLIVLRIWQKGVRIWVVVTVMAIYGIVPLFPIYAVNMQKDTLFSCSLVWLALWLTSDAREEGKMDLKRGSSLFILGILPCLLRNNGIYIVIVLTVLTLLLYKKDRIGYFSPLFLAIVGFFFITRVIYPAMGVDQIQDRRETYGLFLQQAAYVISNEGNIGEEEAEVLFKILPEEDWKEAYQPCLVDSLKWHRHFDNDYFSQNSDLFLKTVVKMFFSNPVEYIKATCLNTFGFWVWGVQLPDCAYADTGIWPNDYGIFATDYTESVWDGNLSEFLDDFDVVIGSGSLLWIIFVLLAAVPAASVKKLFLLALPALVNWLTILVATPLAFSMRYVFVFTLITPLIVVMAFVVISDPHKAEKKCLAQSEGK